MTNDIQEISMNKIERLKELAMLLEDVFFDLESLDQASDQASDQALTDVEKLPQKKLSGN